MGYTDEWTLEKIKYSMDMSTMFGQVHEIEEGVSLYVLNKDIGIIDIADDVYEINCTTFAFKELDIDIQCKTLIVVGGSNVFNLTNAFRNNKTVKRFDLRFFDMQKMWSMNSTFNGCDNAEEILFGQYELHTLSSMSRTFRNCSSIKELDLHFIHSDKNQIGMNLAFSGCSNLERLNLKNIGNVANGIKGPYGTTFITDCYNLKEVISGSDAINKVWKEHLEYLNDIKSKRSLRDKRGLI